MLKFNQTDYIAFIILNKSPINAKMPRKELLWKSTKKI